MSFAFEVEKELFLHEETWLQKQNSYMCNDGMVEHLLNSW